MFFDNLRKTKMFFYNKIQNNVMKSNETNNDIMFI